MRTQPWVAVPANHLVCDYNKHADNVPRPGLASLFDHRSADGTQPDPTLGNHI